MTTVLMITVEGPRLTKSFGDNFQIGSTDDIVEGESGTLMVATQSQRADGAVITKNVVYAKGEWIKYIVTKIEMPEPEPVPEEE